MATEVKLEDWPEQSEAGEAAVSAWFKKPGQTVRQGELLAELIVEKVNLEVTAPVDGILLEIKAEVGEVVEPGTLLARLGTAEEWTLLQNRLAAPSLVTALSSAAPTTASAGDRPAGATAIRSEVVASPAAKRLLRENNLSLAEVVAYLGDEVQRVGELEVKRYLETHSQAATGSDDQLVPYSGRRKLIGERMSRSLREIPQLTISSEVDVTALVESRAANPSLSYTALIGRAVALSLPRHPYLNAALEGEFIRLHSVLNLGIAVDVEGGLVVPVIKEARRLSVAQLSAEINRLAELARQNALTLANSVGGTFTISNLGAAEVDVFTPVINPPQVAILGVGRIAERAGVINGQLAPHKLLWLSLSFDHRVVDGGPAAAFLKEVRGYLENPHQLFRT